jgi:hypothetical protein
MKHIGLKKYYPIIVLLPNKNNLKIYYRHIRTSIELCAEVLMFVHKYLAEIL